VQGITTSIINELRERLESTDSYEKQLGLITEMEEKYNLEEGILLSQYHWGGGFNNNNNNTYLFSAGAIYV
jgi:hypothetical protein